MTDLPADLANCQFYTVPPMSDVSNVVSAAALAELFGACSWFAALEAGHQELVLATARAEHVANGAWIARRNAPSDYWLGVHTGLLKLAIYNESGRSCTFSGVPRGGWFGEGSVIKRELRKYDVVAIQPSLVMLVPAATFHALLAASLPFSHFVIGQLNDRMGEFIASIQNHRLMDADARVAQSLAQLFNPQLYPSTDLTLAISQEELGYLTGLSRQRVNQALQTLADAQILALAYHQIKVLDLNRLRQFGLEQI